MLPLTLINYFELGAFLISLLMYPTLKGTVLRVFPFFLCIVLAADLAGLYTLSETAGFVFYSFIFLNCLEDRLFRKMATVFLFAYPALVLLQWIWLQGPPRHSYLSSMGSVCMMLFSGRFFYELLLHPLEGRLREEPLFWICTGILFFHLGSLSYNVLYNLLGKLTIGEGGKFFQSIDNNLILMLYSCFIIAFLCKRGLRKSPSP